MIRDAATQAQVDAARPGQSTWLAANAGSGKTRVLTDRVARLLLEGVSPQHILCLTYTKAAASEMQNRLFKRLGAWAMLDEAGLRDELQVLGVDRTLDPDFLRAARTLFARAIETPGGLRIQTIHSFCAALLRRFPLEAGVSPQFTEMEDRAAERLRAEILDRMADGPQAALIDAVAPYLSGDDDLESLLAQVARMPDAFAATPDRIRAAYGLAPEDDEAGLLARVFLGSERDLIDGLVETLGTGSKTDLALADKLAAVTAPDRAGYAALKAAVLTQAGTVTKRLGTKGVRSAAPALFEGLDQLAARVEDALETERALTGSRRDIALYAFAQAFLPLYAQAKQARGWLDFDDLITRTRDLLNAPDVAAWVLYRLDGGIDHILVDEAQDTSPVQWQVIERLAQEFTAGEGARSDVRRTIFVVGDKKQSIYSFQGADPTEFDRMREEFRARLERTDAPLVPLELEYSFRSAEPILRLVDNTFEHAPGADIASQHRAFKDRMPGRVDLWPVVEKVDDEKDGPWHQPLDRTGAQHHSAILARRIAHFIDGILGSPLPVEIGHSGSYAARPVHAGDVLILVQRRGRLFSEIIRACKQKGLPIAGADRLKVMAELAVRDVVALLSFLSTPEDSLSLATALRSPLFGLSEQELFDLAHRRKGKYLWEELRRREDMAPVLAVLNDLRAQTDFLRPYDLIDRILTRHGGRRLLTGRLGPEALDGIDALLGQALAYEQTEIPSLTGFLEWVQSDNLEIKRAPDSAGPTLRVMTVHGAKGLEAPIVILPDCAEPRREVRDSVLRDADGAVWKHRANEQPARQRAALEAAAARQARERDRLLYVAMTRAEKWLVVAAAGSLGKQGDAWYEQVRRGMEASGAVEETHDFGALGRGTGLRIGGLDGAALDAADPPTAPPEPPTLPAHLAEAAPVPDPAPAILSPSDLGGAKALPGPGDPEEVAKARGTCLHLLLEHLAPQPPEARGAFAPALLADLPEMADLPPETYEMLDPQALVTEALATLSAPGLARFFGPDSLAEVPITAELPDLGRIHGVIDRLVVTGPRMIAADFKSNRIVPDTPEAVPEGLLRQMGAYAAALAQVFPGREIETGLIWTATAHYMPLSHDLVTQSLVRRGTA
ncbi:double-strand break repair helicase AddA [Pseudoponticoccus marisrubri]|uniref:DNA 3'-5' helicase n=1 Tax=Pseudoponticoccus marisrubri TaxID=1685382 RepID=A0A0W7WG25_9RHOB|nr:double-strand break repair helicase AddA [Pseudoponticoccus marisrubri]KUF09529.1 DNA helicase UvrD [Pseudoponticoccus marisrubri]